MIRTDRWKLVYYPRLDRHQLFDLEADPHERHDLSTSTAHADHVNRLRSQMVHWFRERGDTVFGE